MQDVSGPHVEHLEAPRKSRGGAWETEAKRILKSELARRGLTYKALVARLAAIGVEDEERAIANRISRGKFSFLFFLQCMRAIGAEEVDLRAREGR